jgi:hypothetical protein
MALVGFAAIAEHGISGSAHAREWRHQTQPDSSFLV